MIRCFSYGILVAHLDKTESIKEEATSYAWWCCCLVKDILYITGYVIPKTILTMTGIMPSGTLPWSIADNTYAAVTNAKEVMKFSSFIGNCVYQTIDSFVNKICANVCE